jgi:beta-glucosidase
MAPRALVGFERVEIKAGAMRRVKIHIDERAFSYWSADRHAWQVAEGERRIAIAASSRDIRLEVRLPAASR